MLIFAKFPVKVWFMWILILIPVSIVWGINWLENWQMELLITFNGNTHTTFGIWQTLQSLLRKVEQFLLGIIVLIWIWTSSSILKTYPTIVTHGNSVFWQLPMLSIFILNNTNFPLVVLIHVSIVWGINWLEHCQRELLGWFYGEHNITLTLKIA